MVWDCIDSLLQKAQTSLDSSFDVYWPVADNHKPPDQQPDPKERCASMHVAHAMLSTGFAVFGEADFPPETEEKWLDLLGIAPRDKGNWFLACEFKQLWGGKTKILDTILCASRRLEKFWLRKTFPVDQGFEAGAYPTVIECECGYGLVGGLYYVTRDKESNLPDFWRQLEQEILENLKRLAPVYWLKPLPLHRSRKGQFFLPSVSFQIRR